MTESYFEKIGVHPDICAAIRDMGFSEPMPIQEGTLPATLQGNNIIGQAQTGSGKTAAFLVAAFHRLLTTEPKKDRRPENPRVLALAPTRELVKQIADNAHQLGAHTDLKIHTVLGGVDYTEQRDAFADGVDVLIGTPGRLIDYYKQGVYSLKDLDVIIFDECDRMFDLGFIVDIRWLIRKMPPHDQRQNLLFSATVDHRVSELAWEHMGNPEVVAVDTGHTPPEKIKQTVFHLALIEKHPLLISKIRHWKEAEDKLRVIIFTNMRHTCLRVADYLEANGIKAMALSGALNQNQRFKALESFKQEDPPVIVATDVASRGLHIDDVTHVVNWDIPDNPKDYVHRVGRTARAGAEGEAIILATEDTVENLPRVEEVIGRSIEVEWADPADFIEIKHPPRRPRENKSGGGARRGGKPGQNRNQRGRPSGNRNKRR